MKVMVLFHMSFVFNKGGCPGFRAGSAIRSAVRYKKLDETGVFGLTCRHEHPVKFLNLKYGERYLFFGRTKGPYTPANLRRDLFRANN